MPNEQFESAFCVIPVDFVLAEQGLFSQEVGPSPAAFVATKTGYFTDQP